jgi:hypothetical protein
MKTEATNQRIVLRILEAKQRSKTCHTFREVIVAHVMLTQLSDTEETPIPLGIAT